MQRQTYYIGSKYKYFAKLLIIMQKRSMDLKEVFKYSLGPFPWALAGSVGDLKKTNKSALLHELQKKTGSSGTIVV